MSLEPRLSSLRKRKAHRLLQQSAKDILNMPETVLVRRINRFLRFFLVGSQCTFRLSFLAHPHLSTQPGSSLSTRSNLI